ncbi:MAG: hypothetical protein RLZZ15_2168 [Verrucomicrobiota bacterium]|jgi:TolB-like protein/Tfp pilus assembly protein PilF
MVARVSSLPATTTGAVFLSYASQDAAEVQRLAAALREAGVEVWFDQNELGGGDAWDAKIRKQIAECVLFAPVISANTQARLEGYFRVEWKLAAQRTHAMAEEKTFLLPVVIDDTRDAEAKVPGEFRAVQWTRLTGGEATPVFVARVKNLLGGSGMEPGRPRPVQRGEGAAAPVALRARRRGPAAAWIAAGAAVVLVAGVALWPRRPASGPGPELRRDASATTLAVADAKSVAVLPFANLSGDKEQEYFSDGLTEEVLGALRRERDLTVPGNTSCFSFKGRTVAAAEIAKALNVSRLVEGSVQRVGSRVRIRVTLARPADNSSEELGTFTEELTDIFALQEKVARAVVAKLTRRTTTAPVAVLTKNPEAYDAYLRGRAAQARGSRAEATKLLEQAVALDPAFALAVASLAEAKFFRYTLGRDRSPELVAETRALIDRALELQPNLPEALIVRANWERRVKSDYTAAQRDLGRAEALQPATAELRNNQAFVARDLGQWDEAFRFSREMVRLDPNNAVYIRGHAADIFWRKGDYAEADRLLARAEALQESYSADRIGLRLIWRGPAAALRLLDRAAADSTNKKMLRIDLLLAMDRQNEARALAGEVESDLMAVATDGEGRGRGAAAVLSRLVALRREDAARRLAAEIGATALKELERDNRGSWTRRIFITAEIMLGHRDAALAALEEWRRESQLVQNNFQRLQGFATHAPMPYALLGKADEAIALLREFAASGLHFPFSLRYDFDFAPIRRDPRFQELMRQQEAWAKAQPDPVDL